jgi:hypothetical protein
MRRSRNAALWPAEGLVGGKGKRDAERHQEDRIYFVHHGTPTHSQHQLILGRGFRGRQGIINEWLRRNLNGCKARTRMCCLAQATGLRRRNDDVRFWHTFRISPWRLQGVAAPTSWHAYRAQIRTATAVKAGVVGDWHDPCRPSKRVYVQTPSNTLNPPKSMSRTIVVSRKPAFSNRDRYSASVRSTPPTLTSISRSA